MHRALSAIMLHTQPMLQMHDTSAVPQPSVMPFALDHMVQQEDIQVWCHSRQQEWSCCTTNGLTAELPEAKEGSDWLLPDPIWKLTPVGSVPVWPLDLITLYAVT